MNEHLIVLQNKMIHLVSMLFMFANLKLYGWEREGAYMLKKIIFIALAAGIVAGTSTTAFANEKRDETHARVMPQEYIDSIQDNDPFKHFIPPHINYMCEPLVTRSITVSVPVTEPCDQYWRKTYPDNWMWQANRAVTAADDPLEQFGVQFYSVAQKYWTSDNTSSSALVAEARDEWGLTDGASLMIAFSGRSAGGIMGQVTDIGAPYMIVYDYGHDENKMTVLHEISHSYNMRHCALGTNCWVAEAAPLSTFGKLCPTHKTQWQKNCDMY